MSCSICYERFTSPVSLPCGHIFCRECVCRTVGSKPPSVQHLCPTCRKPYIVVTIDPALIPQYLQPHIQPAIRPVFFDESARSPAALASPSSQSTSSSQLASPPPITPSPSIGDLGHPTAKADVWRRRAQVHAAANQKMLGFARVAKEAALRMRAERDAARNQCQLLKRKLAEVMANPGSGSDSDSDFDLEHGARMAAPAPGPRGLPVFLRVQQKQVASSAAHDGQDSTPSQFGPPIKRRRVGSCAGEANITAGNASIGSMLGSDVGSH